MNIVANKQRLTETSIKSLPQQQTRYRVWDALKSNLILDVLPSGKKVFRLYYRHKGKPRFNTLGTWGAITLEQARNLSTSQLGDAVKGIDLVEKKRNEAAEETRSRLLLLETFINDKYAPWATSNLKSGSQSLKSLDRNFSWLMNKPMDKISVTEITKWQTTEIKRGLKPITINRALATLRGVLTKAVDHNLLDQNPITKVKDLKHADEQRIQYLTAGEEINLRTALKVRHRKKCEARLSGNRFRTERDYPQMAEISGYADHVEPLVLLAMNTGMRRGELFQLNWEKVNLEKKFLTVSAATAKSSKTRHIPLNKEALTVLSILKKSRTDSLVFSSPKSDNPLTTVKTAWREILKNGQISNFRFHDLRHHFASKLVMGGVDLNTVRELLGHASLDMTLRYAHLAPEHKAQAVALLDEANEQQP